MLKKIPKGFITFQSLQVSRILTRKSVEIGYGQIGSCLLKYKKHTLHNYISYFQLVRKIRALIIEPTSSAASCFNVPTSSSLVP